MFNPYVLKILISVRDEDSISAISERIGLSYGWAYKWINALTNEGVFKEKWRGIVLEKNNKFYRNVLKFIENNLKNTEFYYFVLSLFGIEYCFTKTDAVYIWTEGRYNIARYRDFYPIFIKVKKEDYDLFLKYCRKLNLRINAKKGIFYLPEIVEEINCEKKQDKPVESLKNTINFMKENIYNFQPALEMVQEMYKKKLGIKYREVSNL